MNYILLIQNSRGQSNRGVELSKPFIRALIQKNSGLDSDIDLIPASAFMNCLDGTMRVMNTCFTKISTNEHSTFIGGDHFSSFGTILASLKKYGNTFRLVWLDAHTDIHSFDTSPSMNMHGMVVRLLMTHSFPDIPRLLPNQIIYIGIRSVELAEREFIRFNKIKAIWMEDFIRDRDAAFLKIGRFIKNKLIHISLDVDVLDQDFMPSTGTVSDDGPGMSINDLLDTINHIRNTTRHFATDIMEFNPHIGTPSEKERSISVFRRLLNIII